MKKIFRPLRIIIFLLFIVIVSAFAVDRSMSRYAEPYVFDSLIDIPVNKCGLLLGTSKYRVKGGINPYFRGRIDAAVKLFNSGKIQYIIASGDNSEMNYNEPRAMMAELKEHGIPADNIYLDYAGFRTLDSVVRASEIFGQKSITVISQRFHNERAVYIGRNYDIAVVGYNAEDNEETSEPIVRCREIFARLRAFIDVKIIMEQPRFLGKKIVIP